MFETNVASPLSGKSTGIAALAPASRAILRCRAAHAERISKRVDIALPQQACRSTSDAATSALWLGPDEWLLRHLALKDEWAPELARKLDGELCSLVDVSHRQVALSIQGPHANGILASGCALDLSSTAFPIGMCTRTMFLKAEIILWRNDASAFVLEVWRSFAPYVETLLREAESEISQTDEALLRSGSGPTA